jgi:hypothetical protein
MSRFRKGELHSGKSGKIVTDPKQAQAIALSACGQSKYSETLQSIGFPVETAELVTSMFAEIDWNKQFKTGKGPGPEESDNYHTGKKKGVSPTDARISKTGVKGDLGKPEQDEPEMLSGPALEKGPGNPMSGSSKEVFGLRALG